MNVPFEYAQLDQLMNYRGVDAVVATSRQNVQYLLGGYRCGFFATMDAIGISRYLPAVGYIRDAPSEAFYVGTPLEEAQQAEERLWVPTVRNVARTSVETAETVATMLLERGVATGSIAVELPFLPSDAYLQLRKRLPRCDFVDGVSLLEELRAVKQAYEVELLRDAADGVAASFEGALHRAEPGMATSAIGDLIREEQALRGIAFEYCLIAAAPSLVRFPGSATWEVGRGLSLDSGGTRLGYIGDVARMGVLGQPTEEMRELLDEVNVVQVAAEDAIVVDVPGGAIYEAAETAMATLPHGREMKFEAHGIGLVSHEVPHLTDSSGWPYSASDAGRLLESGMAISIETSLTTAQAGLVKLEDTVIVEAERPEVCGTSRHGWIVVDA